MLFTRIVNALHCSELLLYVWNCEVFFDIVLIDGKLCLVLVVALVCLNRGIRELNASFSIFKSDLH